MTALRPPKHRQAVAVGIHALPYSRDIGMTERHAGARAILGALDDAGLDVSDVDGMARYLWEDTTEMEMARLIGAGNLRYFGEVDYGGGAGPPTLAHAAMAIERGLADVVVTWRARNRSSGGRPWVQWLRAVNQDQFERPHGLVRPADSMALSARLWMERWGWKREDLAEVAIRVREYANRNPAAMMHDRTMTLDDYMDARWIAEPLCLFDCCLETDGALALVLVSADRAADLDLPHGGAYVTGYGMGSGVETYAMTNFYQDDIVTTPAAAVADELWPNAGLDPGDIDVVQLYDAFTPQVLVQFQEYGFCGEGEAPTYLRSSEAPALNTSGGGLSEAYVHGFNLLVEGVRQIRGTSTGQVDGAQHVLVTGGNVVPTGGIVFSKEPW